MLWGPGMQPIPSNDQRAELSDIILCGRDLLKVLGSEDTVQLPWQEGTRPSWSYPKKMLLQGAQMGGLRETAKPYPNPKVEEGKEA